MTGLKSHIVLVGLFVLVACGTNQQIGLTDYVPIIDSRNVDMQKFESDLADCRQISLQAREKYKDQYAEELAEARGSIIAGMIVGAVIGGMVGDSEDAALGAAYVGVLTADEVGDDVDYMYELMKQGPVAIIDHCMIGRDYKLLSQEGFGGG